MKQYFFILGREPELSVTEIWQVANFFNITLEQVKISEQYLIVKTENLDIEWWQQRLGGTIKIGEIIGQWSLAKEVLTSELIKFIEPSKQTFFGFSCYGPSPRWLTALGLEIKKGLKGQGKVRFVVSREKILSSVVVQKNRLLPPTGYEFNFFIEDNKVTIGKTLSVQPFEEFSHRDFDRPSRDSYVGMLPPKLARMMINFASTKENLLDPFCGSGTVLQEAALLGVQNMVGSDSSEASVSRTKENIKWLRTKMPSLDFTYNIYHQALETLRDKVKDIYLSIVCEPFLGRPLTGRESDKELQAVARELTESYARWLKILSAFLKNNGRLVMVWPAAIKGKDFIFLPLDKVLSNLGLKQAQAIPEFVPKEWLSPRGTMMYFRPGQKIAREIVILEKK